MDLLGEIAVGVILFLGITLMLTIPKAFSLKLFSTPIKSSSHCKSCKASFSEASSINGKLFCPNCGEPA